MKRLIPVLALLCPLFAAPAFAGHGHDEGDRAEKREKFCKENPQTCERGKQRREEHRKWCEANPDDCKRLKEERRERHKKMREACEANPEKCKERKERWKERRKERHEDRVDDTRESGPPR